MDLNKIYNIDCISFMGSMPDNSVDFLLTDIPYGEVNQWAKKGFADTSTFKLRDFLLLANRITKYSMLIFCGTGQISEIRSFADLNGYRSRLIVWDKEHFFSKKRGDNLYGPNNETAIYIQKDGSRFSAQGKGCQFKALPHIRNIPFGQVPPHPTMKPVSLFKEFILDNTFTGDIVFDPCMGSGTAAIAAIETGRQFLGCELDKKFYSDAVIRINKALYRA